jgi:hypothetical protein
MSWAAANVPSPEGNSNADPSKGIRIKQRGETIEASLSRLSKAYSTAMECIGSMHSLNTEILIRRKLVQEADLDDKYPQSLRAVAIGGRNIFEQAILTDPLVLDNAPTLQVALQQFASRDTPGKEHWINLCRQRPEPQVISSKAHRSTIRQLTYLALTNYADLLMAACSCENYRPSPGRNAELLDKGVVKKLEGFTISSTAFGCCWCDDSTEDVQRLALVALCDAASLDGSDPVVWLKLACAARALGHVKSLLSLPSQPPLNPFRRLERHALECGFVALPENTPPNRAIVKALAELNSNDELTVSYHQAPTGTPMTHKLNLVLTRYSWSLLGRSLIRAFREGDTSVTNTPPSSYLRGGSVPFGSHIISLVMSPMLLLPSAVLKRMLCFLDEGSTWKLEATCRALSATIMSLRAAMEKQDASREELREDPINVEVSVEEKEEGDFEAQHEHSLDADNNEATTQERPPDEIATNKEDVVNIEAPARVSRSSKRVRSQQMFSGKRDERRRNRRNVGFCLRAATLACTTVDPKTPSASSLVDWDLVRGERWKLPSDVEANAASNSKGKLASVEESRLSFEALERVSCTSLNSFLQRLSSQKARPVKLMEQYLGHVALNVDRVFLVDPGDTMVLTTTISSCKFCLTCCQVTSCTL